MSDNPNPSSSSPAAAGWYPDPAGSHLQRWWDGSTWTERTYDPISPASAPGVYTAISADVKVNTPWVWIIAVLPVISLVVVLLTDYRQYFIDSLAVQTDPGSLGTLPASFGTQLAIGAVGWGIYLVTVLLAFFDWRALKSRGVDRPFHWAWAFLFGITYVIGRPIVLKRRGRSAFAPMWVYLALQLLGIIVSIAKAVDGISVVLEQMPGLSGVS